MIHDAPCNGLTAEFLEKHNIHVVCHSTEYDNPEDHYYAVPRALGMTQVLRRTHHPPHPLAFLSLWC